MKCKLAIIAALLVLPLVATAQNQMAWVTNALTATGQTTTPICFTKAGVLGYLSFASMNFTVSGVSLTTVTIAAQVSSDGGVTYKPVLVNEISSTTTALTNTVTATDTFQANIPNANCIRFATSGTFTATSVTISISANQQVLTSKAAGSGGGAVTSVFGRTGSITAQSSDYAADYDPLGATAAVQTAVSTVTTKYGLIPDAHTLVDGVMTASSPTLTDASGFYTSTDVGKLVVVNFAGANAVSTTLSAALSTGSPITSLPVVTTSGVVQPGWVIVSNGTQTQLFPTAGAASGVSSIPVDSTTPNFAYASGSTVTTPALPLSTTIASVQSATQITLAANAANNVSAAEVVYGTNNLTGLQSAVTDAVAAQLPLFIAPSGSTGEGYMISGPLVLNGQVSVFGAGAPALWSQPLVGNQNNDNYPVTPPYMRGSVIIQAGVGVDGIDITNPRQTGYMRDFGVRFAGKWVPGATGNGISVTPPNISGQSYDDNGLMSALWQSLDVFGHDGNHYAFNLENTLYDTFINLRGYGGGCVNIFGYGQIQYGNSDFTHPYCTIIVAGSAHGLHLWGKNTQIFNKVTFVRAQVNLQGFATGTFTNFVAGRTGIQLPWTTTGSVSSSMNSLNCFAGDFEPNAAYAAQSIVATNSTSVACGLYAAPPGPSASGTIYQNNGGTAFLIKVNVTLSPTGSAAASALLYTCTNNTCASQYLWDQMQSPISGPVITGSVFTSVTPGNWYKIVLTNATINFSQAQGFPAP